MSKSKKQELITRYNELIDKYNNTKSAALKGHYAGEIAVIDMLLAKAEKE